MALRRGKRCVHGEHLKAHQNSEQGGDGSRDYTVQRLEFFREYMSLRDLSAFLGYSSTGTGGDEADELRYGPILWLACLNEWFGTVKTFFTEKQKWTPLLLELEQMAGGLLAFVQYWIAGKLVSRPERTILKVVPALSNGGKCLQCRVPGFMKF